jgi:rare lipoprotein A
VPHLIKSPRGICKGVFLIVQHFNRTNRFFLNLGLIFFLLNGCTTAPRYAPQKSPTHDHNRDQQHTKTHIDKPEAPIPSQTQLLENSSTGGEIPLEPQSQDKPVFTQSGIATYYADKFHGKRTAFGEKYDKFEYTAAHLTLPLNTMVKVTCIDNEKSVIVRINDRGPHGANRIIDLSRAAAKEIDLIRKGIAKVKIEVLDNPNVTN